MPISVTYTFANLTTADATQVNQNFTDIINALTDGTKNISVSALTAAGASNLQGAVTLGASTSNLIVFNGAMNSDLPINTNTTYNIGAANKGVLSLYIGGSSTFTTRLMGGVQAASITLVMPTAQGAANTYLVNDGSGNLSWVARLPTLQKFLSGSGTYTTPSNVLYLKVTMLGGGGGGGGSGTAAAGTGGTGGNTTFGTTLLVANGGVGGNVTVGGAGGTASLGTGPIGLALSGGTGGSIPGVPNSATFGGGGGNGAVSPLGGAGVAVYSAAGIAPIANTGSGGAGGGVANVTSDVPGAGGGAGGYVKAVITSPSATYAYAVGAAGTSGTAGTNGFAGTVGGSGVILVWEHYV